MKKITLILTLLFIGLSMTAQDVDFPRIGGGIQVTDPIGGLSAKADFNEQHSAQLVIGIFGPENFSSYYGRYLYNFTEFGDDFMFKPYGFGQLGFYSWEYPRYQGGTEKETVVGYGLGGGIEFHYEPISENVRLNFELSYINIGFAQGSYGGVTVGGGIHYYLGI